MSFNFDKTIVNCAARGVFRLGYKECRTTSEEIKRTKND